jgi:hypothetical protein
MKKKVFRERRREEIKPVEEVKKTKKRASKKKEA